MADAGGGEGANVTDDVQIVISDAEADTLIAQAVRRREEQKSGRSMGRQLPLVAGCSVAGLLLIDLGWRGHGTADAAYIVGVFVMAVAGLLLLRALDLSPATQWGEPVRPPCPACGEHGLREDRVAVPEASGIVALCTPECGYAEVRPDPDGSPEPGGRRKPWSGLTRPAWKRVRARMHIPSKANHRGSDGTGTEPAGAVTVKPRSGALKG
jgi:hypothetical protein